MINLSISPCPNDTFAFYDLIHHSELSKQIELSIADIDSLNQNLLKNNTDFCKASFYAIAKTQNNFGILQSGSALGSDCGPLIVSQQKELSPEMTIAIPGELTTANLLLSLCYPKIENKVVMPFDKIIDAVANDDVDAGLIIHESRFTYQQQQLNCLIDLGTWWEQKTNCLIPLGAIAVNRQLPKPVITAFHQALYYSIQQAHNPNYEHRQEMLNFVHQHAQEMSLNVLNKHIKTYVNDQTLNLNPQGISSIEKLFELIHKKKLCPKSIKPLIL